MLRRIFLGLIAGLLVAVALVILTGVDSDEDDETSYAGTYQSEVFPAASAPGRTVVLDIKDNGTAVMRTDFQDNPAVVQEGTWVSDAGALVVTLSMTNGNPLPRPVRISFLKDGDTIQTVGGSDQFGSEGLTLTRR